MTLKKRRTLKPKTSPKKTSKKSSAKKTIAHNKTQRKSASAVFPIIAIGASAGGLESYEKFLSNVPPQNGCAYVILSHLDREHVSALPDILSTYTSMPVVPINKKITVVPDTVYVITPNTNPCIKNGNLDIEDQEEPHFQNQPINHFFYSLAKDCGEHAIAIVMSGLGADGALGISEIKNYRGTVLVQDPQEAAFDSMPQNAIKTKLFDAILPAAEMYAYIENWRKYEGTNPDHITRDIQLIINILRTQTGHDFSSYKIKTISRRIEKRVHFHNLKDIKEYAELLSNTPSEAENLFHTILIGVTSFFRDPHSFDALKEIIKSRILLYKAKDATVRVWIPGCSTGEEIYSIAILFKEAMQELKQFRRVQIFGTDIDRFALETARAGVYPLTIANEVSSERLQRFFIKQENSYRVKREIRELVVFGEHDITRDPPFIKLDLLCCRNLLIYLETQMQKKLLPLFHYSLVPDGILFLGASETTSGQMNLFKLIYKHSKIFLRQNSTDNHVGLFHFSALPLLKRYQDFSEAERIGEEPTFLKSLIKYLDQYQIAPCFIANAEGSLIYVHGKISKYYLSTQKDTPYNVWDMVHPNLRPVVKTALRRSIINNKEITSPELLLKHAGKVFAVKVVITPLNKMSTRKLFTVRIEETMGENKIIKPRKEKAKPKQPRAKSIHALEAELLFTKTNLGAMIEELETTNEELQLTNEELQSTNEEMETTKEELQSLNEELIIVNTELQAKIDQLALVNDDMNNLFNSTDVAAFFLDNNLNIKRFTPKAKDFMHLLHTDIGRSIGHLATTLKNVNLVEHAQDVLNNLSKKVFEAETNDGKWYVIRILPYRTLTNVIDGVVITFSDMTFQKNAENYQLSLNKSLTDNLAVLESIITTLPLPLLVLDADLKVVIANQSFYNFFKLTKEEAIGGDIHAINDGFWNKEYLIDALSAVIRDNTPFDNYELEINTQGGLTKKLFLNGRRIFRPETSSDYILVTMVPK